MELLVEMQQGGAGSQLAELREKLEVSQHHLPQQNGTIDTPAAAVSNPLLAPCTHRVDSAPPILQASEKSSRSTVSQLEEASPPPPSL